MIGFNLSWLKFRHIFLSLSYWTAFSFHLVRITIKIVWDGVSKILRTYAVKFIKLTIRTICHHHPRSSSLPHLDTGPTGPFIFGTRPFLSECQALSAIRPDLLNGIKSASFQLQFNFLKYSTVGWGWQPFCIAPETTGWGRRCEMGRCHGEAVRSVLTKVRGDVFARFHAVAAESGIHSLACWDRCFALPQLLCRWRHQSAIFWIPSRIVG
jgi:hypothetical protein